MNTKTEILMKKYLLFPIAALALVFTACSSDETKEQTAEGMIPININAVVEGADATRGFVNTNLPHNTKVYVWADMINISDNVRTEYFKGWELKATSTNGARLMRETTSEAKFFPATNVLDMWAVVGNFSGYSINSQNSLPVSPAFIYHTVRDDQTTAAAYYGSDLLYSQVRNQEPVDAMEGLTMKFYHMLSRVRVVLIPGHGDTTNDDYSNETLRNATVTLLDLETRAKFTPVKGVSMDDFAGTTGQPTRAAMITTAPKNVDDAPDYEPRRDITISTGVAAYNTTSKTCEVTNDSYGDAIIVPQTVSAGNFIKVTFEDQGTGLTHDTYFRFADDFTFEGGKQYQFKLTLDRIGETYSITPTISAWTAEENNRAIDLKQPN